MAVTPPPLPRIESPCVSICSINPETRCCDGCGRTLKEIAKWSRLTDAERTTIMAELPARRARLAAEAS